MLKVDVIINFKLFSRAVKKLHLMCPNLKMIYSFYGSTEVQIHHIRLIIIVIIEIKDRRRVRDI